MEPGEIDPVKYGVLWERVTQMDKKIDKMEGQIAELLELANKGKIKRTETTRKTRSGRSAVVWVVR